MPPPSYMAPAFSPLGPRVPPTFSPYGYPMYPQYGAGMYGGQQQQVVPGMGMPGMPGMPGMTGMAPRVAGGLSIFPDRTALLQAIAQQM